MPAVERPSAALSQQNASWAPTSWAVSVRWSWALSTIVAMPDGCSLLSVDLRTRVLAAISAGVSGRQAAQRFGVSAASASRWRHLERAKGDAQPRKQGGDRRSGQTQAHAGEILRLYEAKPDISIEELQATLAETGVAVGYGGL
jgi:transposase